MATEEDPPAVAVVCYCGALGKGPDRTAHVHVTDIRAWLDRMAETDAT